MTKFKIYKRLMDFFCKGDLIRITKTGEVFIYESSTGGANFSSYLIVNIGGTLIEYRTLLHVDEVEKVSREGLVLDDFKQHEKQGD
jgi:hypothetical protein